jgi:hypothetical protein
MNRPYLKKCALVFFAFSCVLIVSFSKAQCLVKLPLEERIAEAVVVVEGKVIAKKPVWNKQHTKIYTLNTLEIFKVFKGTISDSIIGLITEGGMLDGQLHVVDPELNLEKDETGIFILKPLTFKLPGLNQQQYIPVGATQGFIRYDKKRTKAIDVTEEFKSRDKDLYPRLIKILGKKPIQLKPLTDQLPAFMNKTEAGPVIQSFFPITRKAGIFDTLSIRGSGFGSNLAPASVQFASADDGGKSLITATQVLVWNDTLIKVLVPFRASSGNIVVNTSASLSASSAQPLTVLYNITDITSGGIYRPSLINNNGAGGYTFLYSTSLANKGISFAATSMARTRFEAAVKSWKCNTGYNITVSNTSTPIGNSGSDGVNLVAFDNDSFPLPKGVLGRAYSFYAGCSNNWWVNEIDVVFKRNGTDSITWYFGDLPSGQKTTEVDFESVALHELGHSHGIGHVNKPSAVMHFAIYTGTNNRVLDMDRDVPAGKDVLNFSKVFNACQMKGMIPLYANTMGITFFNQASGTNCTGASTANVTGGVKPYVYAWNDKTAQNTSTAKFLCPGAYKVRVMDSVGCSISGETTIALITSLPSQHLVPTLMMHPNPVEDFVSVSMNALENMPVKMELFNAMGALVYTSDFSISTGLNTYRVNMSPLALGVYYMSITSPEGKITTKLLKL